MASPPPTVLLTGASGFVGAAVVRALRDRVPDATILAPAARLNEIDAASLPDHLDGVFHLAARTPRDARPETDADVHAVIESNVVGLESLLDALRGRCRRLVFASTADVYRAPAEGEVLDETSPLGPATVYAASKVLGESMVRAWAARHGARCAILRLANVYGPGEERYGKLIPTAIRRALAGEPVVLTSDPASLRDFVHVADAAGTIVAAWRALETDDVGVLNVASGTSVPIGEVARLVCELAGGRVEQAANGTGVSYRFDPRRLRQVLGERPATPIRDGLRDEIECFRRSARG